MSYYDDDYDDDCSSEDDIYYHNYSVDYANQILGGQQAISSCLPLMRRKHRRRTHTPRLIRVSTLDQMPIVSRQRILPALHSRPKYTNNQEDTSLPLVLPPSLPSLEATNDELERRATRTAVPVSEETSDNVVPSTNHNPASQSTHRPMTEAELRQVQQQQEAFQQHLLNMQRHLLEQSQEAEQQHPQQQPKQQRVPASHGFKKRAKVSFHDLEHDDDQAEIAELIETDPYFAAAMEDFAHTHGLLHDHRHRTHSDHSSSRESHHSQHLCKRHRTQLSGKQSRLPLSSSSSSVSSAANANSHLQGANSDLLLLRELNGIRQLMQEYLRDKKNITNSNQPIIQIVPVPCPPSGGQYLPPSSFPPGIHYPPVAPVTDYQPQTVPRERPPTVPEATRAVYQNVVNAVKEVMDTRPPAQRDQPLKPSDIDPRLKHVYTKRPRIPPSNPPPTSLQRPPLPSSARRQQQPTRRRSSQMTTPPVISLPPAPPPPPTSSRIPPAPPYEPLANFSSIRSTINQKRTLSYGNREKQSHIYDTLLPGHYLHLYTNKHN